MSDRICPECKKNVIKTKGAIVCKKCAKLRYRSTTSRLFSPRYRAGGKPASRDGS